MNSIEATESVEFVENYFSLFLKMKITKTIVFYKFYRFCEILFLVLLKGKLLKLVFYKFFIFCIFYRIHFRKTQINKLELY